jgi:hypothetical protein
VVAEVQVEWECRRNLHWIAAVLDLVSAVWADDVRSLAKLALRLDW